MTATAEPLPIAAEKKQPNRQRRHVDHFRTDDAEHAELADRARNAGLSVDAFCRLMTLGSPGPRSKRGTLTEQGRLTREQLVALNRIGGNVNQGIRALNEIAMKAPEARSRDRLADEIAQVREALRVALADLADALAVTRAALD